MSGFFSSSLVNNTTASNNTAVGYQAAYTNTTGNSLTAIGGGALYYNTTGIQNTAVGLFSMYDNTTGSYNAAIGQSSLENNTTGISNTALGYYDFGPIGTSVSSVVCSSGCLASIHGTAASVGTTRIISGVPHLFLYTYFTYLGNGSADNCTGSDATVALPSQTSSAPADTCAPGQVLADANNVHSCIDYQGKTISTGGPAIATGGSGSTTANNVTTNPDGTSTVTSITTNNYTGAQTVTTTNYAAGVTPPVTPGTTYNPNASKTGTDQGDFCLANPTAASCQIDAPGSGHGVASSSFYTPSSDTFATKLASFKTTMDGSGWLGAANSFLSIGPLTATCSLNGTFDLYDTTVVFDVDSVMSPTGSIGSLIFPALKAVFWICCAWLAFTIAFL